MKKRFQLLGFIAITAIMVFTVACGSGPKANDGQIPAGYIGRWYQEGEFAFEVTKDGFLIFDYDYCEEYKYRTKLFYQDGVLVYQEVDLEGNPKQTEVDWSMLGIIYGDAEIRRFNYKLEPDGRLSLLDGSPCGLTWTTFFIKGE